MPLKRNIRYASTPEPPAGAMLATHYREETTPSGSKTNEDDSCGPKPPGRLQLDYVCLKYARRCLKIGTWNVRTLYIQGKLDNLIKEAKEMNLDILGVSETRWTGEGIVKRDNHTFIYSGGNDHRHGVGILCKANIAQSVMGVWTVSPRNILIKLRARPFDMAIIQTYAPTSDYTEEEMEEYYEELQLMIRNVKSTDVLTIMGDFNAKVGRGKDGDIVGQYGLGERNDRGGRLIQFCIENDLVVTNTFFQKPERKLYTWKSPGDWTRNQIDYILIKRRFQNSVKNCQTYPGADINSDHNPVSAKLKIKLKRPSIPLRERELDIGRIKSSEEIQEKYKIDVSNRYDVLMENTGEQYDVANEEEKINMKWNIFKESIQHANKEMPKKENKASKPWMTPEISKLMTERKQMKNKPEYKTLNDKIKQECRKAKDNWLNHKCRMIEIFGLNNKEAHDEIRLISGRKRKANHNITCIKDKEGQILFETDEIQKRWCQYIGDLFDDKRPRLPSPSNNDGPKILASEIENALKKTKDGKAGGEDGITTDMLKILEVFTVEKLTELFNDIYDTGQIPEELARSVYLTIPKKPKATECGDYRTISLMPHVTKLLLKIILERIRTKIDTEVGDTQFGFRKNNGTREAIFCLNIANQKYIAKNKEIYACFIDYAKAFDRVQHHELIKCLERTGIDGKDIRLITNLYWLQKAAIRIQGELSPYTEIKRGVRQGCVLSPYLFNLYTEFIFRKTDQLPGIKVGGRSINNFRYADDTVLMAEDGKALQTLTTAVKTNSEKMGMNMNAKKTKVMVVSRNRESVANIHIDGECIETVSRFKYLGQQVENNAKSEHEIRTRITIAKTRFSQLKQILTSKSTQLSTRLRVLQCYVHSALLYGSETWTLTKVLEKKIESFEMWTFRRLERISWKDKKSNKDVLDILGIKPTLLGTIKIRKLKYFGHIRRHNTIMKDILEGTVEGKRSRGRPIRTWMDDIKGWSGLSATECNTRAMDRDEWRCISRRPQPMR